LFLFLPRALIPYHIRSPCLPPYFWAEVIPISDFRSPRTRSCLSSPTSQTTSIHPVRLRPGK
jgi:hypothetical protein